MKLLTILNADGSIASAHVITRIEARLIYRSLTGLRWNCIAL